MSEQNRKDIQEQNRVQSGVLVFFYFFFAVLFGKWALAIAFAYIFGMAAREFMHICRQAGCELAPKLTLFAIVANFFAAAISPAVHQGYFTLSLVLMLSVCVLRAWRQASTHSTLLSLLMTVFALVYIGFLPSHLVALRGLPGAETYTQALWQAIASADIAASLDTVLWFWRDAGTAFCWMSIYSVAAADIAAYYAGRRFGRHKLSAISPGKTREGALIGMLVGVCTMLLATFLANMLWGLQLSYPKTLLVGIGLNLFGQLGDLLESILKRSVNLKDSGQSLPGHGGMLDRLDSNMLAAVFAYYAIKYFVW